jgi:hypothetical protein
MSKDEFAEYVAEVRHLGRLPKPIVTRPNGQGYVIVDGEHAWRAAQEVGLADVPIEVIEADDFEAMRQTYKRNQHGTANPVKLGRVFKRMLAERDISIRQLAEQVNISEGTVRNNLLYAEAAERRGDYGFSTLAVKQMRTFSSLPQVVADAWLDEHDLDMDALDEALNPKKIPWWPDSNVRTDSKLLSFERMQELVDAGYLTAEAFGRRGFANVIRRAYMLFGWERDAHDREYLLALMPFNYGDTALGKFFNALPVSRSEDGSCVPMIGVDRFRQIVARHQSELGVGQVEAELHAAGKLAELKQPGREMLPTEELNVERAKELPAWLRELDALSADLRLAIQQWTPNESQREILAEMHRLTGQTVDNLWAGYLMNASREANEATAGRRTSSASSRRYAASGSRTKTMPSARIGTSISRSFVAA